MRIPHPGNPQHVENLTSLPLLEAQGFKGTDTSLAISLFEYGLAWRELPGDDILFIHRASHGRGFDRTVLSAALDVRREWPWVDWRSLFSWLGSPAEDWDALPLPDKVSALVNYYGVEEIFGTTYWEGFQISED